MDMDTKKVNHGMGNGFFLVQAGGYVRGGAERASSGELIELGMTAGGLGICAMHSALRVDVVKKNNPCGDWVMRPGSCRSPSGWAYFFPLGTFDENHEEFHDFRLVVCVAWVHQRMNRRGWERGAGGLDAYTIILKIVEPLLV